MRSRKVRYNFYSPLQVDRSEYPREFSHRSCRTCSRLEGCLAFEGKNLKVKWLDLAKCGCTYYLEDKKKEVKKLKTIKKFLESKDISDKEAVCISLYFSGFTMADAYAIAFNSKAKGNSLNVAASHFFSTWSVRDLCKTLARYIAANGFKVPKKFEN